MQGVSRNRSRRKRGQIGRQGLCRHLLWDPGARGAWRPRRPGVRRCLHAGQPGISATQDSNLHRAHSGKAQAQVLIQRGRAPGQIDRQVQSSSVPFASGGGIERCLSTYRLEALRCRESDRTIEPVQGSSLPALLQSPLQPCATSLPSIAACRRTDTPPAW